MKNEDTVNVPREPVDADDFGDALLAFLFRHGLKVALDVSEIEALRQSAIRAQPEAPKVEQEPVRWEAYVTTALGSEWVIADKGHKFNYFKSLGLPMRPLYTHPAPASDELLEALDYIASIQMGGIPVDTEAANTWCGAFSDAQDVAIRAIAKHKESLS